MEKMWKNKEDFHIIFDLTSPWSGQFQSYDQCLDHVQWVEVIGERRKVNVELLRF